MAFCALRANTVRSCAIHSNLGQRHGQYNRSQFFCSDSLLMLLFLGCIAIVTASASVTLLTAVEHGLGFFLGVCCGRDVFQRTGGAVQFRAPLPSHSAFSSGHSWLTNQREYSSSLAFIVWPEQLDGGSSVPRTSPSFLPAAFSEQLPQSVRPKQLQLREATFHEPPPHCYPLLFWSNSHKVCD